MPAPPCWRNSRTPVDGHRISLARRHELFPETRSNMHRRRHAPPDTHADEAHRLIHCVRHEHKHAGFIMTAHPETRRPSAIFRMCINTQRRLSFARRSGATLAVCLRILSDTSHTHISADTENPRVHPGHLQYFSYSVYSVQLSAGCQRLHLPS